MNERIENEPLPEMNDAILQEEEIKQLFRDVESCAELLHVRLKMRGAAVAGEGSVTLGEARSMLIRGEARGVQLRYRYGGDEFWDTLMCTPEGVRLVRIKQP